MKQTNIPFQTWDIDLLVDYILKFHPRNTRKYGGELLQRLTRLAATHHELESVAAHFRNSMADLDLHCQKEENVLYPYILALFDAAEKGEQLEAFHCGTIEHPINAMMADHTDETERHERIAELTNNYTAPENAEPEYRKAINDLRLFRDYLLEHIHVENEVLFPRALALEGKTVAL